MPTGTRALYRERKYENAGSVAVTNTESMGCAFRLDFRVPTGVQPDGRDSSAFLKNESLSVRISLSFPNHYREGIVRAHVQGERPVRADAGGIGAPQQIRHAIPL